MDDSDAGQREHIRRLAEVAGILVHSGLIVLISETSSLLQERNEAREILEDGEFIEILIDTSNDGNEQSQADTETLNFRVGGIDSTPVEIAEQVVRKLSADPGSLEWMI